MTAVRLRHPDLGGDRTIEVDALAVPHYRAAGWQIVPEPSTDPAPATSRSTSQEGE